MPDKWGLGACVITRTCWTGEETRGQGREALPKEHWNGTGLLRSLSQIQLWLQRTLPGRCAGLRSPLFPGAQERLPTWPQQQAQGSGRRPPQHCPPGGAVPAQPLCPGSCLSWLPERPSPHLPLPPAGPGSCPPVHALCFRHPYPGYGVGDPSTRLAPKKGLQL